MKKIDVFLLAAGESSRMFPLSTIMEKSLLPVNGKPVIRHIIENLTVPEVAKHIRRIIICCLTKFKKQFEHEFRDMPSIEFKTFDNPMGTVHTVMSTDDNYEDYKRYSEYVMVHYADCLTEIDYADFISKIDPKFDGLIAVTNSVKHDYSEVHLSNHINPTSRVTAFYEKPLVSGFTWSGIALIHLKNLIEEYDHRYMTPEDFAFHIFPQMIEQCKLWSYQYNGSWYDVGNLNSYRKVCALYDGENNK